MGTPGCGLESQSDRHPYWILIKSLNPFGFRIAIAGALL
jgi:hypothetical protein